MKEAHRSKGVELLEVLTVGLPFCGFKILTGLSLTPSASPYARSFGAFLVALGVIDAAINVLNLAGLALRSRRPMDACLLALATRPLHGGSSTAVVWQDFGNSADVLLSFALVAFVIGGGRIHEMPADRLTIWNACVVLNVLGAGLGRFGESLRELSRAAKA
jgi:hypothetical protein